MSDKFKAQPLLDGDAITPAAATSLIQFLQALSASNWDMLVCTDGSGSTIDRPGGFAAVMIDRRKTGLETLTGNLSRCTSQKAEVRAVYEVASALARRKLGYRKHGYHCHVVTDSSYVARSLTAINRDPLAALQTKSHTVEWVGIQYVARTAIFLHPHHVPRNSNPLMTLADTLSKSARLANIDTTVDVVTALKDCEDKFSLYHAARRRKMQ